MIKPPKILLYYLVIVLVFIGLSYVIPDEGIGLGKSSLRIKWMTVNGLLQKQYAEDLVLELDTTAVLMPISIISDSLLSDNTEAIDYRDSTDLIEVDPKSRIEYPPSFKKLLSKFYRHISIAGDSGKIIRILHMGDSQIEGDRITRYLRESFQKKFNGCGPGLIPAYDPQKQFPSVWINNKGKWSEHAVYKVPRLIKGNEYGIMGKVAKIDSAGVSSIKVSKSHIAQPKASVYYKARLFLKSIEMPMLVVGHCNGYEISRDSLPKEEGITEINWSFENSPKNFSLDFESDKSPVFLGLSLDSLAGVAVDNIAMRGQSTPRLDKTDALLFRSMASYLNIGLVILQYGTNMVPTISDNYEFYRYTFLKQLKIIKETMPNVPVLVVGVGDVATSIGGDVTSYKHVYKIKEAQKAAAFDAGFAFFDLYEVMGGEGSIIKWANANPKLAMSDYTHFNKLGGKKVAGWIYDAILCDYNKWNKSAIFSDN